MALFIFLLRRSFHYWREQNNQQCLQKKPLKDKIDFFVMPSYFLLHLRLCRSFNKISLRCCYLNRKEKNNLKHPYYSEGQCYMIAVIFIIVFIEEGIN